MGIFNNIDKYSNIDIFEYIRNITQKIQISGGGGLKLDSNNNFDIQDKTLANVAEGTDPNDCIVFHQLETELASKVDKRFLSSPSQNIGRGKIPTDGLNIALFCHQINTGDSYNDNVDIRPRVQDFSNITLYIPNLKNYDGINDRKSSDFVINSIENNITGSLKITNQGFIDITRGPLKIDVQVSEISKVDLGKLYGTNSTTVHPNKVSLYDTFGGLNAHCMKLKKIAICSYLAKKSNIKTKFIHQ